MKNEIKVKHSDVFEWVNEAYDEGIEMIGFKGGTGSAKTFDLMIFSLLVLPIKMPEDEINPVITVISESMPHLKRGAIRYAKHILDSSEVRNRVTYNKTDHTIDFGNCILEFISADRIGAAVGNRRFALYGNEINNLNYEIYEEMCRRSKINLFDFNPTAKFWLEDKLLPYYTNHKIFKPIYTNNYFLPKHEKERIELRAKLDPNFKRVHIDCEYGVAEGLVFENWNVIDDLPSDFTEEYYGMDFGFSNSYTALVRVLMKNNNIFVKEMFYKRNILNTDIIKLTKDSGVRERYDIVYADSADPKTIEEIFRSGINIKPATESKKNVNERIDKLKTFNIFVTKDSINLIRELRNYRWQQDKNGDATNKPIKIDDHAIDALGYAINDKIKTKRVAKIGV